MNLEGVVDLIISEYLSSNETRSLARVNHSYFKRVVPKVEGGCKFLWPHEGELKYYKPSNIICYSNSNNASIPSFVTGVYFCHKSSSVSVLSILNSNVKRVSFHESFNGSIDDLPPQIEEIILKSSGIIFKHPLEHLPSSLRSFKVTDSITFTSPLSFDHLPPLLHTLHLCGITSSLDNLPDSLRELKIHNFDCSLDYLPSKLLVLELLNFSYHSNCSLDNLPPSLTSLKFISTDKLGIDHLPVSLKTLCVSTYDTPIDHLPPSLTCLEIFDNNTKQDVLFVDCLPPSLQTLKISGDFFLQPLDHLPSSLKILHVINTSSSTYSFPLDNLPIHLNKLSLQFSHIIHKLDHLPPSLLQLSLNFDTLSFPLAHLPPSITHFKLCLEGNASLFNLPPNLSVCIIEALLDNHVMLPPTVTQLASRSPLDSLPPLLTYFHMKSTLHPAFVFPPLKSLTPNLTILVLGIGFNQSLDKLPDSLLSISIVYFCSAFNQPINHLPPSLTDLDVANQFNHPIDHLPPSLRYLYLGDSFNQPVNNLPHSLIDLSIDIRSIALGEAFNHPLDGLPLTTRVRVSKCYPLPIPQFPPYDSFHCSDYVAWHSLYSHFDF